MPKPILCLSEQLRQFLEIFRSCFSKRQWKYFVIVLLGLIECEERKTMTGLLRVEAEEVSPSGLSRFLSKWLWEPNHLVQIWLQRFHQRLESAAQTEHLRLKAEQPKRVAKQVGQTCGEMRRDIQADHKGHMLAWLKLQFRAGQSVAQLAEQLAL